MSGVSTALAATADSTVRSQWTTCDVVARLAVRSHLPSAERAHFGQYKTAQSLYDVVVARYSSPATAALNRLMLPYLFPDLAAFATVADLVAHLRASVARYRAGLPTEFCAKNPPPPDHFLSLCPTELTIDLLEERLAAAEKSILAVGASRGDHRTPFFEGCSPVPLLPSVASAAALDLVGTEEVGAASAPSERRRTSKNKGSKGGGGGGGGSGGGGGGGGGGGDGGGGGAGSGGVSGGSGGRGGGGGGGGGSGSGGGGAGRGTAAQRGGVGGSQRQQQQHTRETPSVQQLRECGEVCELPHTTQRCFGRLTDAWRTQFPDAVELPRWHDLLLQNVPIFDLDFDSILAAMYALADSAEGHCYLNVPPDPGIAAAALGASASAAPSAGVSTAPSAGVSTAPGAGAFALSGTAPTESLHTFTLDSSASRSFFRDSTTLTLLSRPVAVSLADPSGGPVLAHSSTVLPCPAAPSGLLSGLHLPSFSTNLVSGADLQDAWVDQFTPGGQRVTHCTCSRTGRHLATFTHRPGSSLYTLTTAPPPVPTSGEVAASSQVFAAASRSSPVSAPYSCRPLAHETLLWHHRLGHPSLPRPAPTCVPCVEGRQRAAPHSSSFPPIEAPLQTLHMDVWGPACVSGQGQDRYFRLVVDDYSRYTTVFPLRSKGEVSTGSAVLVASLVRVSAQTFLFCVCAQRETFTLPASPQQNGIAERRIGMVMDVALRCASDQPSSSCLLAGDLAVKRFLATAVTDPLFESTAVSALVAELVDFAATCRLDFATSHVAESASVSVCPPSVGGECALGTDVLEDRQEEFECFAASVPHLVSMLLAPEGDPDAPDIPIPRSYTEAIEGTYVNEVPPPRANIVSGMWIFRVERSRGSPPVFKARYVARGFSQRQGVDFFQTFSPTPKMTTLRVLLHVAAQRDYELHSLDFSTAFLQGSLHEEIWLRRPPGFTGSFPPGTQWSLRRPVYGLRQAPREWLDTLKTTLASLGFAPSSADPSLFLCTDATLQPFYVLVYVDDLVFATADTEALAHVKSELQKRHTCTDLAPLSDESVEPIGRYPELVGCLITSGMGLVLGGRARVVLTGHAAASWVDDLATQRSSQGYTFSLGSDSVSWRSTHSSSVLSSSCEAEIYAGAMAAQELRWLTYLLNDLGEAPRSPPVLYVDNKAMLALCQEHRLEHRTKHIALRYFLARELQQRGQLRLAYVASQANTADVFTKALQPCDHQRFCTALGLVPTVLHLLTS
ncbi:unnamed protein product [Closterium sp. NIES-54]